MKLTFKRNLVDLWQEYLNTPESDRLPVLEKIAVELGVPVEQVMVKMGDEMTFTGGRDGKDILPDVEREDVAEDEICEHHHEESPLERSVERMLNADEPSSVLYIGRHGSTPEDEEGKFCGWQDSKLSPLGVQQAYELAQVLSNYQFDNIWSSDLERAMETAKICSGGQLVIPNFLFRTWGIGDDLAGQKKTPALVALKKMYIKNPDTMPGGGNAETINMSEARQMSGIAYALSMTPPGTSNAVIAHSSMFKTLGKRYGVDAVHVGPAGLMKMTVNSQGVVLEVLNPGGSDQAETTERCLMMQHLLERRAAGDDDGGDWVTINGNHVMIGKDGTILKGPKDFIGKTPDQIKGGKGTSSSAEGQAAVDAALDAWVNDQTSDKMDALVRDLQSGDLSNPGAARLAEMAKEAQEKLGQGNRNVKLYRVELGTNAPRQDSVVRSYATTEQAAQAYLAGYEESFGSKIEGASIRAVNVSTSHIVCYYGQSDYFVSSEKEVIVSRQAMKI
jgi:broad specificity phosphatase PhoE